MPQPARFRFILILILLFPSLVQKHAHGQTPSYEDLQAVYIYNFAKYIHWPEEFSAFIIGVYGDSPSMLKVLKGTLKEKRITGKEIIFKEINNTEEVKGYHMIFIPENSSHHIKNIIEANETESCLIVTERDLINKGAMVSFIIKDNKLRFKISTDALAKVGLKASQGLLRLAIQ